MNIRMRYSSRPRSVAHVSQWLFGVVCVGVCLLPRGASAQIAVFDSASYGQLVQEISQGATEISNLENQLRAQQAMVASFPASTLGGLSPIVGETAGLILQLQNLAQGTTALVSSLNQSYPTSFSGESAEQVLTSLAATQNQSRQAILQAQQIQAAIAANQAAISANVTAAESASASAAGSTEAIQSTNQLVGNVASQLTEQNALLASAEGAQEQAELAAQTGDAASQSYWNQPLAPFNTGKQF